VFDVVIRGGTVVDGTGARPTRADVAVADGRIVAVDAPVEGEARETIDATDCFVTPGFVDPHTHLDAQLCWDASGTPSNLHGVTSVVIGNCGFGIAPCADGGLEYLLRSLEAVEEIPYSSTAIGVQQHWRDFGEYLDHIRSQPLTVNVAAMVPHSALRASVLGADARRAAGEDDRARLVRALERALEAGALGFASSRGWNHADAHGQPVPSRFADDAELEALVSACRGKMWQVNLESKGAGASQAMVDEVRKYAAWTQRHGSRLTWTPCVGDNVESLPLILDDNARLRADGITVFPQISAQMMTTTLSFDRAGLAKNMWGKGALASFFDESVAEKLRQLADPDVRAQLAAVGRVGQVATPDFTRWIVARSPSHGELQGESLADIAAARGSTPIEVFCDLAIDDELATSVQVPLANANHEGMMRLINDPHTLLGLGDSGAHVQSTTNYTYPTSVLADLVRDRKEITLEDAVRRLTSVPADFLGFEGRGRLAVGAIADVNVVDLPALGVGALEYRHDLPGGAARLYRGASGYRATIVNGAVTLRDGTSTGAASGRVLREGAH
jgi:N-acyl-D-aspartate/D-glutamate deacylase